MMLKRAIAASATIVFAAPATVAWRRSQREEEALLREALGVGHAEGNGASACDTLARHGLCVVTAVLSRDPILGRLTNSIDVEDATSVAGLLTAMLLPTIHQMDAVRNLVKGNQIGQRAAAMAYALLTQPSLEGCLHAVSILRPYTSACTVDPALRIIELQPEREADHDSWCAQELEPPSSECGDDDAPRDEESHLSPSAALHENATRAHNPLLSASPQASLLRQWASLLLRPAMAWADVLESFSRRHAHAHALPQQSVRLIVPAVPHREQTALLERMLGSSPLPGSDFTSFQWLQNIAKPVPAMRWVCDDSRRRGVLVLLPLHRPPPSVPSEPTSPTEGSEKPRQSSGVRIEVLLPSGWIPAVTLDLEPGSALMLDSRACWRIMPPMHTESASPVCPVICFRYWSDEDPNTDRSTFDGFKSVLRTSFRTAAAALISPPLVRESLS